jgi:hypothetical protein
MVQLTLPKNSKIKSGKTWTILLQAYRWVIDSRDEATGRRSVSNRREEQVLMDRVSVRETSDGWWVALVDDLEVGIAKDRDEALCIAEDFYDLFVRPNK